MEQTQTTPTTIRIHWRVTDLWRDPEGGWTENGSSVSQGDITVPANLSDKAMSRRIMAAAGIQGFRRDDWCGADWSWRSGCIGAYADIIA